MAIPESNELLGSLKKAHEAGERRKIIEILMRHIHEENGIDKRVYTK